jgi:hypothetical protein
MDAVDDFKAEIENLEPADKRWIATCAVVAIAALLYALLIGSILGDILGFVLAAGVGWVMRWQWEVVTAPSRKPRLHTTPDGSMPAERAPVSESMTSRWRRRASASLRGLTSPEAEMQASPGFPNNEVPPVGAESGDFAAPVPDTDDDVAEANGAPMAEPRGSTPAGDP